MPFDNRIVVAEVRGDQLMMLDGPTHTEKVAGTAKLDSRRTYRVVTTDLWPRIGRTEATNSASRIKARCCATL